jgi:hypothetical protein
MGRRPTVAVIAFLAVFFTVFAVSAEERAGVSRTAVATTAVRSDSELMYDAVTAWRGASANDAVIDRVLDRTRKDSAQKKTAMDKRLEALMWKDPFADDPAKPIPVRPEDRALLAARAEAARARSESATLRAEAALARAETALARAETARAEAFAARRQAVAARNACVASKGGDGDGNANNSDGVAGDRTKVAHPLRAAHRATERPPGQRLASARSYKRRQTASSASTPVAADKATPLPVAAAIPGATHGIIVVPMGSPARGDSKSDSP